MPMLKIMNAKGKYYNSDARELLARYILNPHFHMMFNSVSYVDRYKYHGDKREYYQLIEQIKSANCLFGISNLRCVSNTSDEDIQ